MIMKNIKNRFARTVIGLALIIFVLIFAAACSNSNTVSASDIRSISEGLNCVCGTCDKIVSECDCETAEKLNAQIKRGLSRGYPEERIVQDLVKQYGQRIQAVESNS
ncbi:cytochrome c-type biogenesis protein CcmH [Chloroflexota bacterium]